MNTIQESSNNQLLTTIDILRFPLIFLVVIIHVISDNINPVTLSLNPDNIYQLLYTVISQNLGRIAVPSFFTFSGYLFVLNYKKLNASWYGCQLKKRIRSLLIPYLFWNIIMIAIIILKNQIFGFAGYQTDESYQYLQQKSVIDFLWIDPINYPLWYLRDLIVMTLLSPILIVYIKSLRLLGSILIFLIHLFSPYETVPGISTTAILYFSLGILLSFNFEYIYRLIIKYGNYILLSFIILLTISTYFNGTSWYEYFIKGVELTGVTSLIYIGSRIQNFPKLTRYLIYLSPTVFFIYASHIIYIINWIKGLFSKISFTSAGYGQIIAYFIIPIITVIICLGFFYFLRKFTPKTLKFITGGR